MPKPSRAGSCRRRCRVIPSPLPIHQPPPSGPGPESFGQTRIPPAGPLSTIHPGGHVSTAAVCASRWHESMPLCRSTLEIVRCGSTAAPASSHPSRHASSARDIYRSPCAVRHKSIALFWREKEFREHINTHLRLSVCLVRRKLSVDYVGPARRRRGCSVAEPSPALGARGQTI